MVLRDDSALLLDLLPRDQRRGLAPTDDLTSALLEAELDGERLSDDDVIAFLFLMVVAGNETTTKLLGHAVYHLTRHPEQLAMVFGAGGPGNADLVFAFGSGAPVRPVVGDWDGDGVDTIGVAARSFTGAITFNLRNSNSAGGADLVRTFGSFLLEVPVVGNWDGE